MKRAPFLVGVGAALAASAVPGLTAEVSGDDWYVNVRDGEFGADISGVDLRGVLPPLNPQAHTGTSVAVGNAEHAASHAFILHNLPPVMNQGGIGSCMATSTGYCAGTYTAARHPNGGRKWSTTLPANQVSAAWLYSYVHTNGHASKCPGPSGPQVFAQELVVTGSPSNKQVPYQGTCPYINGLDRNDPGPDPQRLLIGSYKAFSNILNRKAAYLDQFRALLRSGYAIQFGGRTAKGYFHPVLTKGVFVASNGFFKGAHGQVIVGFDDSKGPNGAFLVQNSWGPKWNAGAKGDPGHNGRIWYDYDSWFAGQALAVILYPNLATTPSGTKLTHVGTAPKLFVREGKRLVQDGKSYITLVLHAADALSLTKLTVTSPAGSPASQALNETLRFGYVYVPTPPNFGPGKYHVALTAQTQAGSNVTYDGAVHLA